MVEPKALYLAQTLALRQNCALDPMSNPMAYCTSATKKKGIKKETLLGM